MGVFFLGVPTTGACRDCRLLTVTAGGSLTATVDCAASSDACVPSTSSGSAPSETDEDGEGANTGVKPTLSVPQRLLNLSTGGGSREGGGERGIMGRGRRATKRRGTPCGVGKMHPLNHLARMHACLFGAAATQRQPRNTRQHLEDSSNAMSCGVGADALFRSEASITGTTRAARTRMLAATFHAP